MGPDKTGEPASVLSESQYKALYAAVKAALAVSFGQDCAFAIVVYSPQRKLTDVISNLAPLSDTPRFLEEAAKLISPEPDTKFQAFPLDD